MKLEEIKKDLIGRNVAHHDNDFTYVRKIVDVEVRHSTDPNLKGCPHTVIDLVLSEDVPATCFSFLGQTVFDKEAGDVELGDLETLMNVTRFTDSEEGVYFRSESDDVDWEKRLWEFYIQHLYTQGVIDGWQDGTKEVMYPTLNKAFETAKGVILSYIRNLRKEGVVTYGYETKTK